MKKIIFALTLTLSLTSLAATTTQGVGPGYKGDITVAVTKDGGQITAIEVVSHSDTPRIAQRASDRLTKAIIENQNTDVDVIAGATSTSTGFIAAVKDALSKQ